jgi:hypothetical protein
MTTTHTAHLLDSFHRLCPFPKLLEGTLDTWEVKIGDRHHGKHYEVFRIARWINRIVMYGCVSEGGMTMLPPLVLASAEAPLESVIGVIGGITMDMHDEHGNVLIKNLESRRYMKAFAGRFSAVTIDDMGLWVTYYPPRETV